VVSHVEALEQRVVDLEETVSRQAREIEELYQCIEGDSNLRDMLYKLKNEVENMADKLAVLHGVPRADMFFLPRFGQTQN
jgi:uncharacterized coiled-coil protein SlyX